MVGEDRLSWYRRGPVPQGTRKVGGLGTGIREGVWRDSAGHLLLLPPIPSARLLAPRQDFCSPSHWPARPTKGWLPNQKKGGGVSPVFFLLFFSFSFFYVLFYFFLKIKWSIREESINLNNFFARVVEGRKSREWVWRSSPITTQEDALYGRYECRTRGLCVCVMWTKISPFPQFLPLLSREKKKSSEFVYIPEMPG